MLNVPNLLRLTSVTLTYCASTGGSEKHPVEKIRSTVKNIYSSFHSGKIICFVRNVLRFCRLTFSFTGPPPAEYEHSCWWYDEDDDQSQTNIQRHTCGCLSSTGNYINHFGSLWNVSGSLIADIQVHVRPEGPFMWKPKVTSIKSQTLPAADGVGMEVDVTDVWGVGRIRVGFNLNGALKQK